MDRNRLWLIGGVLVIGVAVIVGWFLGIAPQLQVAHDTRLERVAVEEQNVAFEARLANLEEQFAGLGELEDELTELRQAVPTAGELPDFVRQVTAIADEHQVSVTSMALSDAQPFVTPEAPVATDPAPEAETADAAAPTAAETTAAPATVPAAALTPEVFLAVPVTVTVEGSTDAALAFVQGLQFGDRVITVTNLSTQPLAAEDAEGAVTATISGLIYVLLDASAG
jgi:Tfp pilus assembly protein PilO